jgi:hypothetical protein
MNPRSVTTCSACSIQGRRRAALPQFIIDIDGVFDKLLTKLDFDVSGA